MQSEESYESMLSWKSTNKIYPGGSGHLSIATNECSVLLGDLPGVGFEW